MKGQTVKSVILYGDDSSTTFTVFRVAVGTGTPTSLGSGTVGELLNIDDFSSSNNASYLLIQVDVTNATTQTIYGGFLFGKDDPNDKQKELHRILTEAGYAGVVATDCEQEYTRYLRPGDRVVGAVVKWLMLVQLLYIPALVGLCVLMDRCR